jgi:ATP-dependent RNA helicase DDX46/PRP5
VNFTSYYVIITIVNFQEEEQKRLEMEMQKRRERIEQWRAERKKKQELIPINIAPVSKKWSLEDEDDDDEEEVEVKKEDDENEVDPLDAYMQVSLTITLQMCVL